MDEMQTPRSALTYLGPLLRLASGKVSETAVTVCYLESLPTRSYIHSMMLILSNGAVFPQFRVPLIDARGHQQNDVQEWYASE